MRTKSLSIISIVLVLLILLSGLTVFAAGIGSVSNKTETKLAKDALLTYTESDGPIGTLKSYQLNGNFNNVEILSWHGKYVYGKDTLTDLVSQALKQGYKVIGAINGDFFNWQGDTRGLLVQNKRLILGGSEENFQDKNWRTFGVKSNGAIISGEPRVHAQLQLPNKEYTVQQFNRRRKDTGIYVYSYDYNTSTKETASSVDVVLNIKSGNFTIGQVTTAIVEKVLDGASDTAIGANQMILSVTKNQANAQYVDQLLGLKQGDTIKYTPSFTNREWNSVDQAFGGPDYLIRNGSKLPGGLWMTYEKSYPSTAIGFKSNGDIIMYQADGRGSNGSSGIHPTHIADHFASIGCNNALMLDGGGSSEIVIVENGNPKTLNKPSDGKQRPVANAILLVEKEDSMPNPSPDPTPSNPSSSSNQSGGGSSSSHQTSSGNSSNNSNTNTGDSSNDESESIGSSSSSTTSEGDVIVEPSQDDLKDIEYPQDHILKRKLLARIKGLGEGYRIKRFNDNQDLLYEYQIFGKNIVDKASDVNLEIKVESSYKDEIGVLAKGSDGHFLSFSQKEQFPGNFKIFYNTKNMFDSTDKVYIYSYNSELNQLKLVAENVEIQNGTVSFYTKDTNDIFMTKTKLELTVYDSQNKDVNSKNNNVILWVLIAGGIVLLLGACAFFTVWYFKSKKQSV